jgi:hypothetical protein
VEQRNNEAWEVAKEEMVEGAAISKRCGTHCSMHYERTNGSNVVSSYAYTHFSFGRGKNRNARNPRWLTCSSSKSGRVSRASNVTAEQRPGYMHSE